MYITNPQRNDGFGGQFLNLIRAIVFTEVNGHTFVDTGINSMTIQDADQDPKYFSKLMNYMNVNKFYNKENWSFGNGEMQYAPKD